MLLLKSVGIDDDVALLRVVRSSRCVGSKMARIPKSEAQSLLHWGQQGPVFDLAVEA